MSWFTHSLEEFGAWADLGPRWIEAFDHIDLLVLMRQAQPNRQAVQLRAAI